MMTITERQAGPVTILELNGHLVLYEGENAFRQRIDDLVRRNRINIVLDLKDVSYIDSAGVGVMVGKYVSVRRQGGDMKLLNLSPRTHRVMSITKLLTVFETFESEDDAVRSFAAGAES